MGTLLFSTAAGADPRSGIWAHTASDLKPDPQVVWGQLDNGFRYALYPHNAVPEVATLQFLVLSGALEETEKERGIAHFIEHMCFRGTTDFTEREMVDFFQELGIEYGSDVNAVTSFDYTAYTLDFRDASAELLGKGMRLFRSFADGVTFDPAAIEEERGVILSELRGRDSVMAKGQLDSLQTMFAGLRFPHRAPGGSPESIESLTPRQFRDFYNRTYRSDLMVLVAAGDFEPAEIERMIAERFGSMSRPATPPPGREMGDLVDAAGLRTGLYRIGNVGYVRATLANVTPLPDVPDSQAARVQQQQAAFAQALLGTRLSRGLAATPGGSAGVETLLGHRSVMASVMTNGQAWTRNITALDQLLRATLEWGFEPTELAVPRERQLRMARLMIEQIPQTDPHVISQALLDSIVRHQVFVPREQEYGWMIDWLSTIDAEQLTNVLRNLWDLDRLVVHFSGDMDPALKAAEVTAALLKDRKTPTRQVRPGQRKETVFELKDWGEPTAAELVRELPEVGAKLFKFGNEVRLNLVTSTQEPGVVHTIVRVGTGLLDMPGNEPALKEFGLQTLFASGTAYYRPEQLKQIIDERFLGFEFDVEDYDAFTFRGITQREDLSSMLGVVTEFLYKPKFGTYVHRTEKRKAAMSRASNTMGMQEGMRELTDYLFEGDARFTWGTMVDYLGLSSIDVKRWLEEPLTKGYVEVTIVGDVSEAEALEMVGNTLGSLSPRAAEKKPRRKPQPVKLSARPGFKRIEFVGEQHLAAVMGIWPVTESLTIRDRAALYLLSKVLELHIREEIRNNLGLAYAPSANYQNFDGFPEFGLMRAMIDCSSSETTRIARLVEDIAFELSGQGVDEGEFKGARGILSSRIRRAWLDNNFVLNQLIRAQERPESVDELLALKAGLVDDVTLEEVDAWTKKILTRRNSRTAAIVPKQFVGLFQTN